MSARRFSTWARVRGRKRSRAKFCLAKNASAMRASLPRKVRELQRTVPGSHGMDLNTLFQHIEKNIILLEAKVTILRSLSTFFGVSRE